MCVRSIASKPEPPPTQSSSSSKKPSSVVQESPKHTNSEKLHSSSSKDHMTSSWTKKEHKPIRREDPIPLPPLRVEDEKPPNPSKTSKQYRKKSESRSVS